MSITLLVSDEFSLLPKLFVPNPITETKVPEFPKYLYSIFILYFKFLSKKFTALVQKSITKFGADPDSMPWLPPGYLTN